MYTICWYDGEAKYTVIECDNKRDAMHCASGQSKLWNCASVYKKDKLYAVFNEGKKVKK